MTYSVTEVKPAPTKVSDIEKEINDATSDGSHLVCLEADTANNRLLIITMG
jgi:hypothetical protein